MGRALTIVLPFLLLLATEASACPTCTYQRMLVEHWHIKYVLINLLVPLLIVANRLDLVRFLYVLIPYVYFAFQFHSYLFWHSYPGTALLAQIGWWVWGLNVGGVVLFFAVSRSQFFRWNKEKGLAWWQPVAYAAAVLMVSMIAL